MKSRTSFYNPTLGAHSWRRFWPLPLTVLLVVLLAVAVPMTGTMHQGNLSPVHLIDRVRDQIYGAAYLMLACMAGASFLSAALVFHHLHTRKEIQFYHALPVTRLCLYGTGWLSGYFLLALPMAAGLGLCMLLALGLGAGAVVPALLWLLLAGLSTELIFYGIAVLSCVLAGQTFGALLLYVGINCAAAVIYGGVGAIASLFMPGIVFTQAFFSPVRWLTPALLLLNSLSPLYETVADLSDGDAIYSVAVGFSEPVVLAVYAIVGAALSVLSGYLYQIRRSERAGEMIAFGPVRTLSKIFGALMICVAGSVLTLNLGMFQDETPFWAVVLAVLIFGFLGWMAAEMIVRKTLRVFGRKPMLACGAFLAVLLLLMGVGKTDLFGRVRYVPAQEDIAGVYLEYDYGGGVTIRPQEAVEIHTNILSHRELLSNYAHQSLFSVLAGVRSDRPTVSLLYELQNGHTLTRRYRILRDWDPDLQDYPPNPVIDPIRALLRQPDYCYQTWFGTLPEAGITAEALSDASYERYGYQDGDDNWIEPNDSYIELDKDAAVSLYQAICEDIQAGRVPPRNFDQQGEILGRIAFTVYRDPYDAGKYGSYQTYLANVPMLTVYMELRPEMTSTAGELSEIFAFRADS